MKRTLSYLLIFTLCGSCVKREQPLPYIQQIVQHRQETNDFMNTSEDSPFANLDSSVKLTYYPVNEKFKVIATIERVLDTGEITLGTSDNRPRVLKKYAILKFKLEGTPHQLLVLRSDQGLFLAFGDLTNDRTTYGGGRYIDLGFSDQAEKITLDFNRAYNPYCAYNANYSCPLPPAENYLNVSIEAGEMLYQ